jgi:hypothetical protein
MTGEVRTSAGNTCSGDYELWRGLRICLSTAFQEVVIEISSMSETTNQQSAEPTERPLVRAVYQHYKGDLYTVIGFAFHHDTREELVLYRSLKKGWVNARPLHSTASDPDGWLTSVSDLGSIRPRFVRVADLEPREEE